MSAPLLQIRDVETGYGGQKVLRGISLEVSRGGIVTLIGPNGHGKTTLLRSISGLVKLWAGEILLHGEKINGRRAHQIVEKGIVHIPQGDLLFSDMTVYDNLMMGAYPTPAYASAAERIQTVFKVLPDLDERRNQIASTLSGGERRMLSIGRGLMANGKLLLIDEPSLGLAPLVIDQVYDVIADLKRKLPGRGLWVSASRRAVAEAVRRHQFGKGFKRDVRVAPTLAADTEALLARGAVEALAMAAKAGQVLSGFSKVETALQGRGDKEQN